MHSDWTVSVAGKRNKRKRSLLITNTTCVLCAYMYGYEMVFGRQYTAYGIRETVYV